MSTQTIVLGAVAAVLLFWAVGAYNRLVGLRNELLRGFPAVDAQLRLRQDLLLRWADTLSNADPELLDALRAACRQTETACSHARGRPASARAMTSLRLADEILAQARTRLPGCSEASLRAALDEADATLAFARRQFNEAVRAYNRAVAQFPTWVIGRLFGFRKAGTL
jgi:LemA protein